MQFNTYIYTSFSGYTEHLVCGRNYLIFDLLILKELFYAFMNDNGNSWNSVTGIFVRLFQYTPAYFQQLLMNEVT